MIKILEDIYWVILYFFSTYLFFVLILYSKTSKEQNEGLLAIKDVKEFFYYVIIPCVNEETVIETTLLKLDNIDFKGRIIAVDDGSDDNTWEMMKGVSSDRITCLRRIAPNARQGKGEALNEALNFILQDYQIRQLNSDEVIVGVIDADGALSTNAFIELDKIFSFADYDAAQLRIKMYGTFQNILQVVQDLEFFTINNNIQVIRRAFNGVGFSGNGQFFKVSSVIPRLGIKPWGNALLDDYELTLKLMLKAGRIAYISEAFAYQEALTSVRRYIKQRSRWVQGNLDCLKYVKTVRKSNMLSREQRISVYFFLIQPILNLVTDILVFSLFVISVQKVVSHLGINGEHVNIMTFLLFVLFSFSWGIYFTITYLRSLKRFGLTCPSAGQIILLPIATSYVYIILFFSIVMAFWRHVFNKRDWIKTKRN